MFKIKSDGTTFNTEIFYNDVKLGNIKNLNINFDTANLLGEAIIKIVMPKLDLNIFDERVKIIKESEK